MSSGPLAGIRLVEFEAIGPAPFAVMLLADMGAEVLRIRRARSIWPDIPILCRGRHSIELDLKDPDQRQQAREAVAVADVLVEGFRPGVMERLGLGPELLQDNPRLVYARCTGWGQDGPLAPVAGHDINYIALSGLLAALVPGGDRPVPPLNLLGDYAGGSLYLALGVVLALFERERSGLGQVVDGAIIDGSLSMMAPLLGMRAAGLLPTDIGSGLLAGHASYYRTYECKDGRFMAVGSLEPQFRRELTHRLGLADGSLDGDQEKASRLLAEIFASRPQSEWCEIFDETDACVAPVLDVDEFANHPHSKQRGSFVETGSFQVPAAAPRLSRTPGDVSEGGSGADLLARWLGRSGE